MPVCKVIFRLDFTVNFRMMEAPGRIFQTFWETLNLDRAPIKELSERAPRILTVHTQTADSDCGVLFNASPTSIDGSFEIAKGIELPDLLESDPLAPLVKLADRLCGEFSIDTISRSGFRLFYFGKLGTCFEDALAAFNSFFRPNHIRSIEGKLGRISDVAAVWEGADQDGVRYSCRSGPYRSAEARKYFNLIADKIMEACDFDMIFDLDLHEYNFSIARRTISNLYRPILIKANEFIRYYENELFQRMEEVDADRKSAKN